MSVPHPSPKWGTGAWSDWGCLVLIVVLMLTLAGAWLFIVPALMFRGMPPPSEPTTNPWFPTSGESE